MNPYSRPAFVRLLLTLIMLLAAASRPTASAQDGGALTLGVNAAALQDPLTLGPDDFAVRDVADNLWVGLFRYDAATQSAVPVLAQDWSASADGLTWTFTLRADIPWVQQGANGFEAVRPVTAGDFVAALRRGCDPRQPSPANGTATLAVVAGCYAASRLTELQLSDAAVAELVQAAAPDDRTLVLGLAAAINYLPSLLTGPEFRPYPADLAGGDASWFRRLSSGPYALVEAGLTEMFFARNPFWPEPFEGNIERVRVALFAGDGAALAGAFESGAAQFARLDESGADLAARLPGQVTAQRGGAVWLLGFSTERRFVNEVSVRQAMAWALDREALLVHLPGIDYVPITTVTPPGAIDGPDAPGMGLELEAARALFAAAGHAGCSNVPEGIEVAVPQNYADLGTALIAAWTEAFGCAEGLFVLTLLPDAQVETLARRLVDSETVRPHLWLARWSPGRTDVHDGAAAAFHCHFGWFGSDLPGTCQPVDALIDAANTAAPQERAFLFGRIEARYFGEGGLYPAVPLFAQAEYVAVAAGLTGVPVYGPAWWAAWRVQS